MKALSRNEMKTVIGGKNQFCGTCQDAPGGDPYNNVVCGTLPSSGYICTNLNGYDGLAYSCGNPDNGDIVNVSCNTDYM